MEIFQGSVVEDLFNAVKGTLNHYISARKPQERHKDSLDIEAVEDFSKVAEKDGKEPW